VSEIATIPNLLRLLVVPFFGYVAWRDIRTRRVPNKLWLPLLLGGIALLGWELYGVVTENLQPAFNPLFYPITPEEFYIQVLVSIGFLVPLSYIFWRIGGFGGADAKAFMVLAVLFPTYPLYHVGDWANVFNALPGVTETAGVLPSVQTTLGVFSVTILSNTVLVGMLYPIALAGKNAASGYVSPGMFIAKPVRWDETTEEYGTLLEFTDRKFTDDLSWSGLKAYFSWRRLDLDALRMYLEWRDVSLQELRDDPERFRDPESLPEEPKPPGDGMIATDGGQDEPEGEDAASESIADMDGGSNEVADEAAEAEAEAEVDATSVDDGSAEAADVASDGEDSIDEDDEDTAEETGPEDPWGAKAFLDDIDGSAYGTTPETLREGLDTLTEDDVVWISPGIPFIVPMFFGLLIAFTYGDLLFALLDSFGLVQ
jgi:preflagellin peptidase FlaK